MDFCYFWEFIRDTYVSMLCSLMKNEMKNMPDRISENVFLSRISLIISQKNKSNKMCPGNCRIPSYPGEDTESQS